VKAEGLECKPKPFGFPGPICRLNGPTVIGDSMFELAAIDVVDGSSYIDATQRAPITRSPRQTFRSVENLNHHALMRLGVVRLAVANQRARNQA